MPRPSKAAALRAGAEFIYPGRSSGSSFLSKPSIFDPASAAPSAAPVTAPLAADDTTAATASLATASRPLRPVEPRFELFLVEDADPVREAPEMDFPLPRDDDPALFELDLAALDPVFAREDDPAFFADVFELPDRAPDLVADPDADLELLEPDLDELFAVPDLEPAEPDLDALFAVPDLELLDFAPDLVPDEDAVFLDADFAVPERELDALFVDLDFEPDDLEPASDVEPVFFEAVLEPPDADRDFVFVVAIIPPLSIELNFYVMLSRACFARAAPIAVLTSFSSSGGGRTAGIPSDSIQSSRVQPVV